MAFVLVQHLDPKHESGLGALLGKHSRMPVHEVKEDLTVEPNHVYVIAPNVAMIFASGQLQLEARDGLGPHLIDHFFKSLAKDRKASAIGVVLSGTGTDGTIGLEEIKALGGITLAQDEHARDVLRRGGLCRRDATFVSRHVGVLADPRELVGDLLGRQCQVDTAGSRGALGHA